jgi:hypothetical protein
MSQLDAWCDVVEELSSQDAFVGSQLRKRRAREDLDQFLLSAAGNSFVDLVGCGDVLELSFVQAPHVPEPELTVAQKNKIMQQIRIIHSSSGHCNLDHLMNALKRRNMSGRVLEVARGFRCSVCEERKRPDPRRPATLEPIPPSGRSCRWM